MPGVRRVALVVLALLSLGTAGCSRFIVPSGDPPLRYRDNVFSDVAVTSGIIYGSAVNGSGEEVALLLDIYEPTGDSVASRPAIVWVHGGSFCCGSRTSPEIVDEANVFARKGYFNVSIDYRLEPGGCSAATPTDECVRAIVHARADAQTAVRWLRDNAATYGIDTDRIAIAGTSAGAITALNVGYASFNPTTAVRAAVSLSGAKVLGGADEADAAALLFHGSADGVVPYQWAVDTVDEARAAGLGAELATWDGGGHAPYTQHRAQILDQTTNFLYWNLDLAHAAR
jgi:acetyl esterase/lipase